MPRISTFNFVGAPPDQSGAPDYIPPPGPYPFRVHEMVDGTAKSSGKRMVTLALDVAEGPHAGARIYDYFADLDTPASQGTKRLHAAFIALKVFKGPHLQQAQIDLEKQTGKIVYATVKDSKVPATDTYEERMGTRIASYILPNADGSMPPIGQPPAASVPPVPQVAAPLVTPQPAPAPAAPAPAPAPAADPVAAFAQPVAPAVAEELQDVFE